MRHPIEKSPRGGTAKSTEAVEWVGENGEPTKITPTHWYPAVRNQYRLREEDERSLLAASSFIVILGAATLIATHFSGEVAAYVTRYTGHEVLHIAEQASRSANQGSRKSNLIAQRQAEADQASGPAEAQQAAQQIAAVSVPETPQSLMEDRAEGWAQEPAEARGYRGARCATAAGSREERAIAGRRARESGRSRAGGRRRAKRAGREHGATSSNALRTTRSQRRVASELGDGTAERRDPEWCDRTKPRTMPRNSRSPISAASLELQTGARASRSASQRASKGAARGRDRSGGVEPKGR